MDDVETELACDDGVSALASDATRTGDAVHTISAGKDPSHDSVPALQSYQIKPALEDKFKENPVKEIIRNTVTSKLAGRYYDSDNAKKWTISIANDVNTRVRELKMKRYKHIVQVTIGELKGAGVKCGVRCLWDSETDGYTSDTFMNETIFCVVVVFAVYLY
ncbi:hypothetical protein PPYR_14207 [Photinus pyralis]|uniref:Tctex1 domain-containing protein 2 n=2 Tax=Photinus pyralis TaxID=7054 RepID=A0A5N4A4N1_PHOPY|nr:tctex1 domain-containing protein 2-like [Photinus pyralis]KAB0792248.1 hypothetical protein PPYR_14207 [Photinus pyralis]